MRQPSDKGSFATVEEYKGWYTSEFDLGANLPLIIKFEGILDIWCLHIPVKDRTSFTGLVQLVESTIRSEYSRSPNRPIYLVGESLGGCLA
ncbi:hypothetical protein SLEP1_g58654 [Rubroshorea leprosula]|uniref:Uncharacterized protein n=1 Tax=Rubroshorea leprosula TaxID=152421 RepID=A0AAV5MRI4_9ROSI|nr:hypothetical protein SLEP1_g58654 [Rubroshorea leprosula]